MSKKKHIDTDDSEIIFDEEISGSTFKNKSEKKLAEELRVCQKEKREYLEGWQRTKADFINFKREIEESQKKVVNFATQDFILRILPVLDSFEIALKQISVSENWMKGMESVYAQLLQTIYSSGVKQIQTTKGEIFDPAKHESVALVTVENKKDDGTIVEIVQKGYTLHEKVIRAPRVHVGKLKS